MVAPWLRAQNVARLEDKEGNGSHDCRHSVRGGSGVVEVADGGTTCLHPKAEGTEKDTELPWEFSIAL